MITWDWFLTISLILSILGITGTVLNAKLFVICFPLWFVSNCGWIAYCWIRAEYGQIPMWVTYTALAVYGWYNWKKEKMKVK